MRSVRQGDRRPGSKARDGAGGGGDGKAKGGGAAAVLLRQVRGDRRPDGRARGSAGRDGGASSGRLNAPAEEEEENGWETPMTDPEQVHAERMGGMVSGIVGEIILHHGLGAVRGPKAARGLADMVPALLASMWYDASDDFMAAIDALIRGWSRASRELRVRTSAARGERRGVQRARDIELYTASRGGGTGSRGRGPAE